MTQTEKPDQSQVSGQPFPLARRLIAVTAIIILVAVLAEQAAHNGKRLIRLAGERIGNWSVLQESSKTPGTGLYLLTDDVLAAAGLLQKASAETFRLSPGIRADAYLSQRIAEVNWPKAFDAMSSHVLRLESESAICTTLFSAKGVALDRCE